MTEDERFERIETNLLRVTDEAVRQREEAVRQRADIDKILGATRDLIMVGGTCLNSLIELRESIRDLRHTQELAFAEMRELSKATDEKLNILVDTVDRIIRHRNGEGH